MVGKWWEKEPKAWYVDVAKVAGGKLQLVLLYISACLLRYIATGLIERLPSSRLASCLNKSLGIIYFLRRGLICGWWFHRVLLRYDIDHQPMSLSKEVWDCQIPSIINNYHLVIISGIHLLFPLFIYCQLKRPTVYPVENRKNLEDILSCLSRFEGRILLRTRRNRWWNIVREPRLIWHQNSPALPFSLIFSVSLLAEETRGWIHPMSRKNEFPWRITLNIVVAKAKPS